MLPESELLFNMNKYNHAIKHKIKLPVQKTDNSYNYSVAVSDVIEIEATANMLKDALVEALEQFDGFNNRADYSINHWSNKAARILKL